MLTHTRLQVTYGCCTLDSFAGIGSCNWAKVPVRTSALLMPTFKTGQFTKILNVGTPQAWSRYHEQNYMCFIINSAILLFVLDTFRRLHKVDSKETKSSFETSPLVGVANLSCNLLQ